MNRFTSVQTTPLINEDDAPRLVAEGSPVPVVDALCQRADVPVLGRHGLPDGHVTWRAWPGPSAQAPVVVLLHGGSGAWSHWVRNIPALTASHTVLAPDTPGYGDSGRVPGGTPVAGLAQRLADTLAAVLPRDQPLALVGFSFGGVVAGELALLLGQRLTRLVLVGAVGLGIVREGEVSFQPWRHEQDLDRLRAIHHHNLQALMLKHAGSIDAVALAIQDTNVRRTRYVSKREAPGAALLAALGQLAVSVHGIWGDSDVTACGRVSELPALLAQARPGAGFTLIPDCGHWVQYERAEAFNAALLAALAA